MGLCIRPWINNEFIACCKCLLYQQRKNFLISLFDKICMCGIVASYGFFSFCDGSFMVELVFISSIGVIVLFAGLTVLMSGLFQLSAIFIFLTMIIGYILLILTYRKRKQLTAAIEIIYQGYEKYLYYVAITRAQHKLIVYNQ